MSWGIEFQTEIYLSRQEYKTKYCVEDRIKELDELINECEAMLKMYASATPKDIIPADYSEEQISWLNNQINEQLEMYREYLLDRYRLKLYLDYLEEKPIDEEKINDKNE